MGKLDNSILSADAANELVSEIIRHLPSAQPIDTKQVLAEHPQLREYDSAVLGLAYEQFCRQAEAGEQIDPDEFAAEFPSQQQSLLRMLQVHKQLNVDDALLSTQPQKWPEAGEHFLGLDLIEPLGQGAFSRVFLASEPNIGDRFVVAKICTAGASEAHTLGRLQHSNIVRVINVRRDELSGLSVVYMPYLGRATLLDVAQQAFAKERPKCGKRIFEIIDKRNCMDARIESIGEDPSSRRRMERASFINVVIEIALQLAEALEYTHRRGLCHCDVKPSNVLLTASGRAMLFDFNLAAEKQILADDIRGTIPYMAPEQLECIVNPANSIARHVSSAGDIFAFGATIYQLLTGNLPFGAVAKGMDNRELAQSLLQKQEAGPLALDKVNPDVNGSLSKLILRCLTIDPSQRPTIAGELVTDLRRELVAQRKIERWINSRRRFVIGCAAASTLAAGTAGAAWMSQEPIDERETRLGHVAYRAERFDEAADHFTRALVQIPNDVNLLFWRGRANLKSGEYQQAIADLHCANEQLPHGDCRLTACMAYCLSQQAEELKFDPNDGGGVARYKLYRDASARNILALKQGFTDSVIYHNTAVCMYQCGFRRPAISYLKQAIQHKEVAHATYVLLAALDRRESKERNVPPKLEYIEMALREPIDQRLKYEAASTFVETLRYQTKAEPNTEQLIERTIAFCHELSNSQVAEFGERLPPLKSMPEYKALVNRDHEPESTPSTTDWIYVLDPLGGMDEPIYIERVQVE